MAKIANLQEVAVDKLVPYERNAKIHGAEQIEKLKASIQEFGFLTPCLIDKDFNLIAGHGRVMAAKELGMKTVPCVFVDHLTKAERRAYILADNRLSELGEWDMNLVLEEIEVLDDVGFDVTLTGFDMPDFDDSWFESREKWDSSRQEGNDEYNDFLGKFEEKKTTDDCYTPENIYDAVCDYVEQTFGVNRNSFVRPFYPNGDYENEIYKKTDIVVDNPPFSILSQIVDFYVERKIPFFLFAPSVSTMGYVTREGVAAICCHSTVTYENGARVSTNFITNMFKDGTKALSEPELTKKINDVNQENERAFHKNLPKYEYPIYVLTSAKLGYMSMHGERLVIKENDCTLIRELDAMKEIGKGIFGSGLLLSERAAAERAAAERAAAEHAAAERAAATCWQLSERELEIVRSLGGDK